MRVHHFQESHPLIFQQWPLTGLSRMGSERSESRQDDQTDRHLVYRMIRWPILPQLLIQQTSSPSCRYRQSAQTHRTHKRMSTGKCNKEEWGFGSEGESLLELDVPVTGVTHQSVVGLEDPSRCSRFRLTVFEPQGISSRYVGRWSSHDFTHDCRTGLVLVDSTLDQLLLVLGTTSIRITTQGLVWHLEWTYYPMTEARSMLLAEAVMSA